jgi:hypothetical protein
MKALGFLGIKVFVVSSRDFSTAVTGKLDLLTKRSNENQSLFGALSAASTYGKGMGAIGSATVRQLDDAFRGRRRSGDYVDGSSAKIQNDPLGGLRQLRPGP